MQRKFITSLALLLFLNVVIKGFYILVVETGVQNKVGTLQFGEYFALFNFSFFLNILLDAGITNFNNRNISQNRQLLTKHFSSIVVIKLVLALLYLALSLCIALAIGYDLRLMKLFLYLGFNQFIISFTLYLRSNLAGLHLFKLDSVMSVLDRTFMIVICSVLLWSSWAPDELDVMYFVYAQTASYALQAAVVFIIVIRKMEYLSLKWNPVFSLMILKKSIPFAILILLMTFYNRVDAVMLERMLPGGAIFSGIYAQAYRILDATNMVAFLFASLLLPIFSKMLKEKESIEEMVKLSYSLLIVPAVTVAVGSAFFSNELMQLFYKQHTVESAKVFGLLMSCFAAISTTYIFGTLLTANGNLRELNLIAGGGMVINILLNLWLIPRYQASGSACSSLITQFLTAGAQVLLAKRLFRLRVNLRYLAVLVLFAGGAALAGWVISSLSFSWGINLLLFVIASFSFAFLIRLVNLPSIYRIFRYG
jgi:O-antigen/teichoic acid export membrane protein